MYNIQKKMKFSAEDIDKIKRGMKLVGTTNFTEFVRSSALMRTDLLMKQDVEFGNSFLKDVRKK